MALLNSWALAAGGLALGLPVLIHLLTRPRPQPVELSTIRFVRELVAEKRRVDRLRDMLTLLMRCLAIALIALAIARPIGSSDKQAGPQGKGPGSQPATMRVVIVDVSQSMAAEESGIQALERARSLAARQLVEHGGLVGNLILAAGSAQAALASCESDFSVPLDRLAKATVLPQRLNVQAALQRAAESLGQQGDAPVRRELWVFSDLQRSNWAQADFSALPAETRIEMRSVVQDDARENVAILRCAAQGRIEQRKEGRWEIEVGNYSPTARTIEVEVVIGSVRVRASAPCGAWGRATLIADAVIEQPGWYTGEARLIGTRDALPADDVRPFVTRVHPGLQILLVTRQPPMARPSSSYFLDRALAPAGGVEVIRSEPDRADRRMLASADLIVLDHPGPLNDQQAEWLVGALRRGHGVLYVASESLDATNLKLLASRAGSSLQLPVEYLPAASASSRSNLFLTDVRRRGSPFQLFGDELSPLIDPLRFAGGLASRRSEGAVRDDIMATYNDQSAALVITPCGAGSLAILNAELAASNLPASPLFVPFIGELTSMLVGRDRLPEGVPSGEPLAVYLPGSIVSAAGLEIEGPDGRSTGLDDWGALRDDATGVLWHAAQTGPPGVYRARRDRETHFAFASTIPAEEADLRTLESSVFSDRLASGRALRVVSADESIDDRDRSWVWLAAACLICMVTEWIGLRA